MCTSQPDAHEASLEDPGHEPLLYACFHQASDRPPAGLLECSFIADAEPKLILIMIIYDDNDMVAVTMTMTMVMIIIIIIIILTIVMCVSVCL